MTSRRSKRSASSSKSLERALASAARRDLEFEDGAERLFVTMGIERPHKHERAIDDFYDFIGDEPEQVARAVARRAFEIADDERVAPDVRATLCLVASESLTASVPDEANQAATLLRRAFELDPTLQPTAARGPKRSSRDNPLHGQVPAAGRKTRDR